jgi:hypothetical protein
MPRPSRIAHPAYDVPYSAMTFRLSFAPPTEERWEELFSTPLENLRGTEGLWDASEYLLWTTLDVRLGSNVTSAAAVSLIEIANYPYLGRVFRKFGTLDFTLGMYGPNLVATLEDTMAQISLVKGVVPDRSVVASDTCTVAQFSSELSRAAESALHQLRERMTGAYASALGEWLDIASRNDPMGVDD